MEAPKLLLRGETVFWLSIREATDRMADLTGSRQTLYCRERSNLFFLKGEIKERGGEKREERRELEKMDTKSQEPATNCCICGERRQTAAMHRIIRSTCRNRNGNKHTTNKQTVCFLSPSCSLLNSQNWVCQCLLNVLKCCVMLFSLRVLVEKCLPFIKTCLVRMYNKGGYFFLIF